MARESSLLRRIGIGARLSVAAAVVLALAGCEDGSGGAFGFLKPKPEGETGASAQERVTTTRLVERDVEAPEVFQVTAKGLWDGRPSLGGVWVAHPDVKEPERVIIRNNDNSKFVIGALFRRERINPGPPIQVSSDAAAALGMLAGAPAELNVTALRRETAPIADEGPDAADAPTAELTAPEDVQTTALDPVTAGAAAAIEAAEADDASVTRPQARALAHKPKALGSSAFEKPYIQIGIFSVEQNARNTATAMRQNGMVPLVKKQSAKGKTFWRVLVGPATSKSERSVLLRKIREMGFEDAYPVTN